MHTTNHWIGHFKANALEKRVDWAIAPQITQAELQNILPSLQAWQLGETSEGKHLIAAAEKYACSIADPRYVETIKLFIKEEQKHGNNLGLYLDAIDQPRVKQDWGDTLFRKVRYFNTSMELWTLAVIVVESTAQIFYQSLKDATGCGLLKSICNDILMDEAYHITFQDERLAIIFSGKSNFSKAWRKTAYKYFFFATSLLVWFAHRRVFKAGGNTFESYMEKMAVKYFRTLRKITNPGTLELA
ncbi:MAG TPA: ferritin-like domain-containing protein [Mucilaginibacter sp.]|nr:ferritin-like domain-containing protein [Mucilaginibacter sp.]